jgi:tRNA (guanosine-2'-O-)-methyltransferase
MSEREKLTRFLLDFVSDRRRELLMEKASLRTRHLTVAVENLYQDHNFSAVMRSCDCFGIQDVHVIENKYSYRINDEIAMGAEQWLTVKRYNQSSDNTRSCLHSLKTQGYTLVATTPHKDDVNLEDYDFSKPTALLFGTEKEGLTPTALEMADVYMKVPMVGFTESLNISVCAAVCLHHLSWKLRQSGMNHSLGDSEYWELLYDWVRTSLKDPEGLEKRWMELQSVR